MSTVSTDSAYTFTVIGNRSLTAVFEAIIPTYTITATVDPDGSGTVAGAGQYQEGNTVTLTATNSDGYVFSSWQENGQTVSVENPYTFTATENRSLTALFNVSRLPAGYTERQYITSDKNCTIDAGASSGMYTIRFTAVLEASPYTSGSEYIFAAASSVWVARTSPATVKAKGNPSSSVTASVSADITGVKSTVDLNMPGSTISVNGSSATLGFKNTSYAWKIFGGDGFASMPCKLYSAKLYYSSKLVRDFVPCTNPSGVAGLYDLVGGKFYGNLSSGSLTAGPAV